jgi:uncharacterized protein involved in type VI secretion and phage assembly
MSVGDLLTSQTGGGAGENRCYGVVTGVVKNISDPDGLGRVQVEIPSMNETGDPLNNWARIATMSAGKGRGSFFIPEVEDEVLIAFEHGDRDRPFVIGMLWNSDDTPPETMDGQGKNNLRVIKSRSGHIIKMDDSTDDQKAKIVIKSQGGHQIVLDDANSKGKIELSSSGGHKVTLDDDGQKIAIVDSSGNSLVLDAGANSLTIDVKGNTDQTVGGNLKLNVTGSVTIYAPSGITLDSTSVKLGTGASQALVNETMLTIFNTHIHTGPTGPTSPPVVPAIPGVQSTIFTKGG